MCISLSFLMLLEYINATKTPMVVGFVSDVYAIE